MAKSAISSNIENGQIDPKDAKKLETKIKSKEIAPSFAEQSGTYADWQAIRDQLGQPFTFDPAPPFRKLKQMAKDPMIRFGLHFITTPHIRAPYHVEAIDNDGPNPQVAEFMHAAWKLIHARYIFQSLLSLRWGHQPITKRFIEANPGGYYVDPKEENPEQALKPVWDEGSVLPVIWKDFVALDPSRCQPIFNNAGEFDGIQYEVPTSDVKKKSTGGASAKPFKEIDVQRSLWITYGRDDQFGSIYGYPRIAHAFRYWWSYWYAWAMVDRAIERMAVPPMLAYHPEGYWEDPDNPEERQPYFEIALDAAERLRSNAIAAVPSTLAAAGLEERGTQEREWSFEFLETKAAPIEQIIAFAQYCDIMKLRGMWVPEQAFMEGQGGSSSRNVAERMGEAHVESQANLWEENIAHVNKFVLPQILIINFPEFVNNGGRCRIVGHGFSREDTELLKQLVQLIGQADPNKLGVDIRTSLERLGVPLLTPEQQARESQKLIEEAAAAQPPIVPGITAPLSTTGARLTPGQFTPGQTNGGSVAEPAAPGASVLGFDDPIVYIAPQESINLSESEDFITSLPTSAHYSDKQMRALALQLRRLWKAHLRELYPDLAKHIASSKMEFADDPKRKRNVTKKAAEKAANQLLREWSVGSRRMEQLGKQSRIIMEKMIKRANKLKAKQANIATTIAEDDYDTWLDTQVGRLLSSVHGTARDEVRDFLINEIREGNSEADIAHNLNEHFSTMTISKADLIARNETRDAFNAGTLITAQNAKLTYVKASDGIEFDKTCRDRNGKLMTVKEAWREMGPSRTHPRCQLAFEPIARADFSVQAVAEFPDDGPDPQETFAYFDDKTSTAYILRDADIAAGERWLGNLTDVLIKEGYRES